MLALQAGRWRAALLPEQGAAFAMLEHDGQPVLQPLDGRDPNATRAGAFWMLPWTNRLDAGHFPWAGQDHRFRITHPEENNALHGLARAAPWVVEAAAPDRVVLTQHLARAPFDYAARLEIMLGEAGLQVALRLQNTGASACPMGFGWHPWFTRPPGCTVRFHATHMLLRGDRSLPTTAVPSPGLDGGEALWLGRDQHYPGWDGTVALHRPDATLTLRAHGAWARNLHFFAPLENPVICLEPVSHVPNVINRPDLAEYGAMQVLEAGEAMQGTLRLSVG